MSDLVFDVATAADVDGVHSVLSGAIAWLRGRGIEQWPDFSREYVERLVDGGIIVVVREAGTIVSSAEVHESDLDIWGELPDDALYVHRLVVDRGRAGAGIGQVLLDGVAGMAQQRGRVFLRLDTAASTERLRRYYESAGFVEKRFVDVVTWNGTSIKLVLMERELAP